VKKISHKAVNAPVMTITAVCPIRNDSETGALSMQNAFLLAPRSTPIAADQLRTTLQNFIPQNTTRDEKLKAIEAALNSPVGKSMRETMAQWIVDKIVPVPALVPDSYSKWRAPVRDAMVFVVSRLSPARLAPKLVEQLEMSPKASVEARLLRLIAKVPGLQKLGQVIARNQHLRPALRKALAKLENGIRDVSAEEIRQIIEQSLGHTLQHYSVRISPAILSEASVSAVVRFRWRNPKTRLTERGVFKVLKPHIPNYFAEDMDYLQGLAEYFGERHHTYGFPADLIPDTFRKVRRLLRHEVNFTREQKTLREAAQLYQGLLGFRIPRVIPQLCTANMTAMTEETGMKVTSAAARLSNAGRRKMADHILESLIAVPLLSPIESAIFHGDPHAGNLLYDSRRGQLTIIDWALRERLGREQRRHLALLLLVAALRDPATISDEIMALTDHPAKANSAGSRLIRQIVDDFLEQTPAMKIPSAAETMRLLERVAVQGVKFPSSLIMLSKVMFTLEGVIADIVGSNAGIGLSLARQVAQHWLTGSMQYRSPLRGGDWLTLQCSALLYPGRVWLRWEKTILDRYLPPPQSEDAKIY
jgi:ubiquinone biosynthesis protein